MMIRKLWLMKRLNIDYSAVNTSHYNNAHCGIINYAKKMSLEFKSNTPCNDCPYRKDAPRAKWHYAEFKKLLENDDQQFGPVYGCHKKNDSVCVGWLMDQKSRNFPCLNLRILLMKRKTTARWLETLTSPSAMYRSVKEMVKAQKYNKTQT